MGGCPLHTASHSPTCLALIPTLFPDVWHASNDMLEALDWHVIHDVEAAAGGPRPRAKVQ